MIEREEELLKVAKLILEPSKYEEFINNYKARLQEKPGASNFFEIETLQNTYNSNSYKSSDYYKCSKEEKLSFIDYLNNNITVTVTDDITKKFGTVTPFGDVIKIMSQASYKNVEKIKRKVLFSVSDGKRPIGDKGAMAWNGFQVIDLDIKNYEIAESLQHVIFNTLSRETWFLGVTISSSGKGLHVWTQIKVPENIELEELKLLYALNFRHKYSSVFIAIQQSNAGLSDKDIINFMDMAMFKPQQGVFIPSQKPLLNTNFQYLELTFESVKNQDRIYSDYEWTTAPILLETFSKWEWFANSTKSSDDIPDSKITQIGDYELNGVKIHYKHKERWQLANTLCSIYGFERGYELLRNIVADDVPDFELLADMKTASNYEKPISLWAVRTLNTLHGFQIKAENTDTWTEKVKQKEDTKEIFDLYKKDSENIVELSITKNQYLSDITEQIKENLGHITLLEAGAGFGKTEMIKQLGGKVMLVLPFTSIIESKFSESKEWQCFFQNRSVTKEDLLKYEKICMTADKFSQLQMMEVNFSYFDYIVIDESHLAFLSEYRPVMSKVIDNIAHSASKVILMTGTPSGETLFFPKVKHIIITKEEVREKTFDVYFGNTKEDTMLQMTEAIAESIINGKKVLFPTNAGTLAFKTIISSIERFLFYKGFDRELKSVYYKKANEGSKEMDSITFQKTIKDLDFVACTSYLSVGVDICDKYDFEIYFDKLIIAQDIEQYANRLRNNNLHIKMFLPREDSEGNIDYDLVLPLTLQVQDKELELARNIVMMCNNSVAKNKGEYKYNPIISSVLHADKYIFYSDNIGMYYVDETAYKLHTFEMQYRKYASQLQVVKEAMRHYGYICGETDEFALSLDDNIRNEIKELSKITRNTKYSEDTKLTFKFIEAVNKDNIDVLFDGLSGKYKLKLNNKIDTFKFNNKTNTLEVKSIELFQKNMPLIKSFYKFYDINTIKNIFDYCMAEKNFKINYSLLSRISKLISIEFNNRKGRIDVPVMKFMDDVKQFASKKNYFTKFEIETFLKNCTIKYVNSTSEVLLKNINLVNHTLDMITDLFKVLVTKSKKKKGYELTLNKLLWTEKTNYSQLYGNPNTQIFFLGDILSCKDVKEANETLIKTSTMSEEDYNNYISEAINMDTLDPSNITNTFDYYNYEKNNKLIRDYYDKQLDNLKMPTIEKEQEKNKELQEQTLFD